VICFVQPIEDGPVKIGYTDGVDIRFQQADSAREIACPPSVEGLPMSATQAPPIRRKVKQLIRRNRVVLALHWLADAQGLFCMATNAELARAAGLGVEMFRSLLHGMELRREVAAFSGRGGRRTLILMSHPTGPMMVRKFFEAGNPPEWYTRAGWGLDREDEGDQVESGAEF
jgi:hypothetical protein